MSSLYTGVNSAGFQPETFSVPGESNMSAALCADKHLESMLFTLRPL